MFPLTRTQTPTLLLLAKLALQDRNLTGALGPKWSVPNQVRLDCTTEPCRWILHLHDRENPSLYTLGLFLPPIGQPKLASFQTPGEISKLQIVARGWTIQNRSVTKI